MEVYFYQAECGDAARLRYLGNDDKFHNILIDSGYGRTFRHILIEQIKEIISNDECIDLWIVSHIHDDHIGGIVRYIKAVDSGEINDIVKKWYYNPPRFAAKETSKDEYRISSPVSIKQGDFLSQYLHQTAQFPPEDITNLHTEILHGLTITVLSPSKEKLHKLREKYKDKSLPLERIENQTISSPTSASRSDYHVLVQSFNLGNWKEDDSAENGSSISFITEFQGQKILWLADAHPSDVVQSLRELGYSETNQLGCEWVKVAHHGSSGNNSDELFSLIKCNNYLFSVNGQNRHNLPAKEAIIRILSNPNRPDNSLYNIFFTYYNSTLRSIFAVDGEDVFTRLNLQVHYLKDEKFVRYEFPKK